MFTGGDKDRRIIAHMQAEMRKQADQWRLAHEAQEDEETTFNSKKWVVRAVLIVVAALALFAGARQVFAQGAEPLRAGADGVRRCRACSFARPKIHARAVSSPALLSATE